MIRDVRGNGRRMTEGPGLQPQSQATPEMCPEKTAVERHIEKYGDAVFIVLSHKPGRRVLRTLIDREDFETVTALKWFPHRKSAGIYAFATCRKTIPEHLRPLHRYLLKAERGQIVDHINGDTLDNRRQNLRIVTALENAQNMRVPRIETKTSRFKCVSMNKHTGKWHVQIQADNRSYYVGVYDDEVEAAQAYDAACLERHKDAARTNAMMGLYETPNYKTDKVSAGLRRAQNVRPKRRVEPKHDYNTGTKADRERDQRKRDEEYIAKQLARLDPKGVRR